tara:strand:- start:2745 stop:3338 length:594 start_codon:yes stop_codon:yes gene_type:complete
MVQYENTNKYIGDKFTLDIIGAFVYVVRDRFTNQEFDNFPWKYSDDSNKTRVFIEAGSVDSYEQKDARPGIFLDRSSMVFSKLAINNMANFDIKTGVRDFYCLGGGQISIDCISQNRGESTTLADIVASHVLMSEDIFRSALNFRDMSPVTLGATQPWEKDDRTFITRVTTEFTYDLSWKIDPLAVRLERIFGSVKT